MKLNKTSFQINETEKIQNHYQMEPQKCYKWKLIKVYKLQDHHYFNVQWLHLQQLNIYKEILVDRLWKWI